MSKVTFDVWYTYEYVEVFTAQYKNGAVYRVTHKGYARRERPKLPGEVYAPLSDAVTLGADKRPRETVTLDLLD